MKGMWIAVVGVAVAAAIAGIVATQEPPRQAAAPTEPMKHAVAAKEEIQTGPLPEVQAILTAPPLVPPPVDRPGPAKVLVSMEMKEKRGTLADGVEYVFWMFGDSVPGPFVRVRVGDSVVLKIKNSDGSQNPHSIDLHAVTGPGGGAAVTQLGPGQTGAFE